MAHRVRCFFALVLFLAGGRVAAQPDPRISLRDVAERSAPGATSIVFPATVVENGLVCTVIDFEGVGDSSPIPQFDGITSPNWLGIIDADAGGNGNIAFEPSPQTIAFWLDGTDGAGSSRDILFAEAAAVVEFFYASLVTVTLEAFDDRGSRIASVSGAPNFGNGPGGDPTGGYNRWDRLRLTAPDNRIVRIRVSGAVNRTGIDNLKVCRRAGVDTVEFTQAIQEIQELADLKADLRDDGEPPVPLVRDKPAVMRVYFQEVQAVTSHRVEVTFAGSRESRSVALQPGCDRAMQRQQAGGCGSADFYFTPALANVPVELRVTDAAGTEIERHTFNLRPRQTEPLVLGAVKVCDSLNANGAWLCAENYRQRLAQLVPLLRKLAPTASVSVEDTGEVVRREVDATGSDTWWANVAGDIEDLSSIFDGIRDFLGIEDRRYYGLVRAIVPGGGQGMAAGIPSRGAASRTDVVLGGKDMSQSTLAHETFHMLGRFHTDIEGDAQNPACIGEARDPDTDWTFADSLLRSRVTGEIEIGFDVALGKATSPQSTFDVMSYCLASPWVSPYSYSQALEETLTRAATQMREARATGNFWLASGSISRGSVAFDPLYEVAGAGPTDSGTGDHRLEVRDGSSRVLFTRRFVAVAPRAFVVGGSGASGGPPSFSQLLPVQPGAASLVVRDPANRVIGTLQLAGAPPAVTITFPNTAGPFTGSRDLLWQVSDPDSTRFTHWVQYSPSDGSLGSWRTLGFVTSPRLRVNFDQLPGTAPGARALVRVITSDGGRSTTAVSVPFTVPTKAPSVQVDFPPQGAVFGPGDAVWLQAAGFDAEDGSVAELTWRSNRNGLLGSGSSLPVKGLAAGTHQLTVTGRDAEGKTATSEVQLVVAGAGPAVDLRVTPLDSLPTTCVETELGARAGSVPLRSFEYSLDGGGRW